MIRINVHYFGLTSLFLTVKSSFLQAFRKDQRRNVFTKDQKHRNQI